MRIFLALLGNFNLSYASRNCFCCMLHTCARAHMCVLHMCMCKNVQDCVFVSMCVFVYVCVYVCFKRVCYSMLCSMLFKILFASTSDRAKASPYTHNTSRGHTLTEINERRGNIEGRHRSEFAMRSVNTRVTLIKSNRTPVAFPGSLARVFAVR